MNREERKRRELIGKIGRGENEQGKEEGERMNREKRKGRGRTGKSGRGEDV